MGLVARVAIAGVLASACAVVAGGCGLPTDSTPIDASAGGDDASAAPDGAPGDDATKPSDTGADGDAAPPRDAPSECSPSTPEVCDDGVDNNCDGKIDCADPECASMGYACIPAYPPSWQLVAAHTNARDACPAGYGAPADVVFDPIFSPAICSCTCQLGAAPTCTVGTLDTSYGYSMEQSCPRPGLPYTINGSGCAQVNSQTASYLGIGPAIGASGGSCAPSQTSMTPPPASSAGRTCGVEQRFGGGCSSTQVCARTASAPFATCVAQAGSQTCPTGYSTPHKDGSSLSDTRSCSTCGCAPPTATCTNAAITYYSDSNCTQLDGTFAAPSCTNTGGGFAIGSYEYKASVTAPSCGSPAQPPAPQGTVSLVNEQTVCCL